jgi:hypothetical protein
MLHGGVSSFHTLYEQLLSGKEFQSHIS